MSETVLGEYGIKASKMAPSQMQAVEHLAAECATLRARVAELEAQLATAERRGVERALRWAWLEFADEYAAPFEEKAVSAGLAALFPEANRE